MQEPDQSNDKAKTLQFVVQLPWYVASACWIDRSCSRSTVQRRVRTLERAAVDDVDDVDDDNNNNTTCAWHFSALG
jgi:hypothetical protein